MIQWLFYQPKSTSYVAIPLNIEMTILSAVGTAEGKSTVDGDCLEFVIKENKIYPWIIIHGDVFAPVLYTIIIGY